MLDVKHANVECSIAFSQSKEFIINVFSNHIVLIIAVYLIMFVQSVAEI